MPVRIEKRNGNRRLVIDIGYLRKDGTRTRYRRDSTAPTMSAAREEERRIRECIARTGSPFEEPPAVPKSRSLTYQDLVDQYRDEYMATELKLTTRRGYDSVLNCHLLPALGSALLEEVDAQLVVDMDSSVAKGKSRRKKKRSKTTRNNIQIVLRSTLRFAAERGYLASVPEGLPALKRRDKTILQIPTEEEVMAILDEAAPTQRRAFLLMARAGLRPNEVRGLQWRDVRLPSDGKTGFLQVREGRSHGELHTPKTGQREIPLGPSLERELASTKRRQREKPVALTKQGKPWGDSGLARAFKRVCYRAGFKDWTVYYLRHFAITSWLRAGVPVHVVQRMAGHTNLSTTQGYVHYLKGDLEMAARLIGNILETASEGCDSEPTPTS